MNGLALCAGVGGLDLGIRLALGSSYSTICYVERETYCAEVLAARMADKTFSHAPIWDDLATFEGREFRGSVDIITAGLPCQPYSGAGKKLGHADERAIWPEFIRIVEEVCPTLIFLENVTGFLKDFGPVYNGLRDLGFIFAPPGIYTAAECGAPHLRRRLFVLAAHTDRCEKWDGKQRKPRRRSRRVRDEGGDVPRVDDPEHANSDLGGRRQGLDQLALEDDAQHANAGIERLQGELRAGSEAGTTGRVDREPADANSEHAHRALVGGERGWLESTDGSGQAADADRERLRKFGFTKQERQWRALRGELDRLRSTWRIVNERLVGGGEPSPWTVESPLLRVANGLADRTRQLRAIGGGVVPAVAGRAFLDLSEGLGLKYD